MRILIFILLLFFSKEERYASWQTSVKSNSKETEITFSGKIKDGWYVYASKLDVKGPLVTKIEWEQSKDFKVMGNLESKNAKRKHDDIWNGNIDYFEKDAVFVQKVKILKPNTTIKGTLRYQACINDPEDGSCINESYPFEIMIN